MESLRRRATAEDPEALPNGEPRRWHWLAAAVGGVVLGVAAGYAGGVIAGISLGLTAAGVVHQLLR
jgi:hypothetical protein